MPMWLLNFYLSLLLFTREALYYIPCLNCCGFHEWSPLIAKNVGWWMCSITKCFGKLTKILYCFAITLNKITLSHTFIHLFFVILLWQNKIYFICLIFFCYWMKKHEQTRKMTFIISNWKIHIMHAKKK